MADDIAMNEASSPLSSPFSSSSGPGASSLSSDSRLMITKMELENFKSYAGVREIGPFHKCFSSVVGPNGSGKSNVIDAMLFVFGKRAKKLRLNKVSELIHKSDAVKEDPPTYARVSVFFQEIIDTGAGDDDYKVVPNSERVIARIARSDNSSTYKLDDKNCQFKEIAAYLNAKGINLDNNRFLILQGEVEMISMMPPKGKTESDEGLLEYLEDIIGSSKFVEETNEAAEKVEQLTEQRQEKLNRVKAVEKEKDSLESAKLEAEALLGKEREIRRKHNILYQIHSMTCEKEIIHYTNKRDKAQAKLDEERMRMEESNERVQKLEQQLADKQKDYDKIFEELKVTKEEFTGYERRDIKLREEVKYNKQQKKKLETKLVAEEKKINDAVAKAEHAKENIPNLKGEASNLAERRVKEEAKLEDMFEATKGETAKLRAELEEKTKELAPVQQSRTMFENAHDTAQAEVDLLENATKRAKEMLDKAEHELATIDESKAAKQDELKACEDELQQAKDRVVEAKNEDKLLAEKETKLSKRAKDLLVRSEEAKAALEFKGGSKSRAVQGILEAAKNGELRKAGVLGRLGDLGTIDPKYDVAVSTAVGQLDHIVVQTTAGAQKCLEFLRKYGLGRASFIPLDKMKKGAHDRAVETPENAPRLFDLIQPVNASVAPAMFLAVKNTLVAPDLETATRWSMEYSKRWRVVTVDGGLVETAGTMSGGGKKVSRGKMRLASGRKGSKAAAVEDEEELMDCENLEEQAASAQKMLQELRQARKGLAQEVKDLNKKIKSLETKIPKLMIDINGFETTRSNLTQSIPELRVQSEISSVDAKKLKELQKKVAKCKTDMSSCVMQASKLESAVARIKLAIVNVGGAKYAKQKELCEKLLEDQNKVEKDLSSAKVAISSSEKAIAKGEQAKVKIEEELKACTDLIQDKKAELKAMEVDALKVMEAYESVKALEAAGREELEAFGKEVDDIKKSQSDFKMVEIELAGKLDGHTKSLLESEKKLVYWQDEISKLRAAAEDEEDYDESDDENDEDKAPESEDTTMEDASEDKQTTVATESKASKWNALPALSHAALEKYDKNEVKADISMLESEKNTIAKNANMGAIAEYRKKEADYLARVAELDSVTEERNAVRKHHEDLRRQRLEMFMDGFGQITLKLKEMYQMITLGGDAELELVDSLDPFSEGIVFSVRPPKKSWKNISNLSGGEKTLSSLALVFALHHFKPTPLYVMDEIDAALDFKNVSIVANYIKERTKNAQFIIISLRNNMFELADRLVGIYKTNNCTKSVTIDPRAFGVDCKQDGQTMTPALSERTNNEKTRVLPASKDASRRVSFHANASTETA